MTPAEVKAVVLEALAEFDRAKAARKRKSKPTLRDEPEAVVKMCEPPHPPSPIYALSAVWLDCIGAVNVGRIGKALKPLLAVYDPKYIEAGIRAYAAELHRLGEVRFASPERFASLATSYVLPVLPANELTEREADLIGMTESRNHMAILGLLTDRARG